MLFQRKSRSLNSSITYFGSGCELEGNLRVPGDLRVDGFIRGSVKSEGNVEISVAGAIEGEELHGHDILVYGRIKARTFATGKLTLTQTAYLEGEAIAASIEIEEGAYCLGRIVTKDGESPALPPQAPSLQLPGSATPLDSPSA